MADTVQYLMEQMIPELEDLQQKGYFTRAEIKKIVQKRQNFEYLLKRRAALKEDFYRYIDYESKLEELRRLRKVKLGIKGKKGLSEVSVVRRVHFIYERAARKFRADLNLWMRWIEACKRYKSTKQLSKVITKALQRHAAVPDLWIEAARWEYETNNNIAAARSLMQQGIRMCKHEESIWVEYYRLELLHVIKLLARRKILGLDVPGESKRGVGEDGAPATSAEGEAAARAVMSGAVARIVYKNAVAGLPGRLAFRARFLAVLRPMDFEGVGALRDQVYDSIRADFGTVEEAWDLLARRHTEARGSAAADTSAHMQTDEQERTGEEQTGGEAVGSSGRAWDAAAHKRACGVYEEGLAAAPTPRMHGLYASYLAGALGGLMDAGPGALEAAVGVAAQLFGALQAAHGARASTPGTYLAWVEWAERVQQPKMALKAARKGCERFPSDVALWRRRLALEQSLAGGAHGSMEQLLATFEQALKATQPGEAAELWAMAVEAMPASEGAGSGWARLGELLFAACARVARREPQGGLGQVAAAMVEKARSQLGLDAARRLYACLLSVPGPGGDLFRCAIAIERSELEPQPSTSPAPGAAAQSAASKPACPSSAAASSRAAGEKRVTELYEAALAAHGSSEADLWLEYAAWAAACGRGVGQLHWRAMRQLADPDAFVARYREALAGQE